MPHSLRIAYFAHTLRSDWNNGNAHFLRGLLDNLRQLGHEVTCWEPYNEWSLQNLRQEPTGEASLAQFAQLYPDLKIKLYPADDPTLRTTMELDGYRLATEWSQARTDARAAATTGQEA